MLQRHTTSHAKWKQITSNVFIGKCQLKVIIQINSYMICTKECVNLLKKGHHSYNRSWYLDEFSVFNCHCPWPICLLYLPASIVKCRSCRNHHHPFVFHVCDADTHFCNSFTNVILLPMHPFPQQRESGFHSAFQTIIALTPNDRESMCE